MFSGFLRRLLGWILVSWRSWVAFWRPGWSHNRTTELTDRVSSEKRSGLDSGLLAAPGLDSGVQRVLIIEHRVSKEKPSGLDSALLAAPGLNSNLLAATGLDSGLLVVPRLDSALLGWILVFWGLLGWILDSWIGFLCPIYIFLPSSWRLGFWLPGGS